MGQVVDHPVLGPVETFYLFIGQGQRFIDSGIFNGQGNHVGDSAQQIYIGLVETSFLLVDRADYTDHAFLNLYGDIQHGTGFISGFVIHLLEKVRAL